MMEGGLPFSRFNCVAQGVENMFAANPKKYDARSTH